MIDEADAKLIGFGWIDRVAEALREDYRRRGAIPSDARIWKEIPDEMKKRYRDSAMFILAWLAPYTPEKM